MDESISLLTQNVLGTEFLEVAEMVVAVEDGRASNDGHQYHIDSVLFDLFAPKRFIRTDRTEPPARARSSGSGT